MAEEYYCPEGCKLPTERNILTEGMFIMNKCFFCSCKLWDESGNFLGRFDNIKSEKDNEM